MKAGSLEVTHEGDAAVIKASGDWTVGSCTRLDQALRQLSTAQARQVSFDLAGVERLDTAGAWLAVRTLLEMKAAGIGGAFRGVKADHAVLLQRVADVGQLPALAPQPGFSLLDIVARMGRAVITAGQQARGLLSFFGATLIAFGRVIRHPSRIRFTSLVSNIEQHGLNAIPIVGLLLFFVGIVVAYQGYDQLRKFGQELLTVDLTGIIVLREMGVLITAIIIAGRSGSAFTAQIGTMQVNEEVDAIRTLGLDPIEVLVLPRVMALLIALPLLTFFANIIAILGGAFMANAVMDMSFAQFLDRLQQAVEIKHFLVGMVKAPVFAVIISLVGCYEGMRVSGSAESVGRLTTQSVVESLFLVIILDAFFANMFSYLDI
ncbi:MAG: MlaE family lipid ABC transporter permease subunit [Dongiaceae bacterium]